MEYNIFLQNMILLYFLVVKIKSATIRNDEMKKYCASDFSDIIEELVKEKKIKLTLDDGSEFLVNRRTCLRPRIIRGNIEWARLLRLAKGFWRTVHKATSVKWNMFSTPDGDRILEDLYFRLRIYIPGNRDSIHQKRESLDEKREYEMSDIFTIRDGLFGDFIRCVRFFVASKRIKTLLNEACQAEGKNIGKMLKFLLDMKIEEDQEISGFNDLVSHKIFNFILDLWYDDSIKGNFFCHNAENDNLLAEIYNLFTIKVDKEQVKEFVSFQSKNEEQNVVLKVEDFKFSHVKKCFELKENLEMHIKDVCPLIILQINFQSSFIARTPCFMEIKGRRYRLIALLEKKNSRLRSRLLYFADHTLKNSVRWVNIKDNRRCKLKPIAVSQMRFDFLLFEEIQE